MLIHQGLLCRWLSGSAVPLERCVRHLHSGASWEVGRVRDSSASRECWSSSSTAPGHPHGACSCPGFLLPSEFQKPGPRPSSALPRPHPLRPGRRPVADRHSAAVTVRPQEGPLCQCRPGAGKGPEYVRLPGGVHPLIPARPPQELRQYTCPTSPTSAPARTTLWTCLWSSSWTTCITSAPWARSSTGCSTARTTNGKGSSGPRGPRERRVLQGVGALHAGGREGLGPHGGRGSSPQPST